ncbi:MAG TPA: DUF2357 domain-containing protein [Thermoprotei archaeon]|nr:DUF2357 domain-containing protein [Thermoprotei archaeon]
MVNSDVIYKDSERSVEIEFEDKDVIGGEEYLLMYETKDYHLILKGFKTPIVYLWNEPLIGIREAESSRLKVVTINFTNYIGKSELRIYDGPGRKINLKYPKIIVVSKKISDIMIGREVDIKELRRLQLEFTSKLVEELVGYQYILPFELVAPTSIEYTESDTPPHPLFIFHYLRRYSNDILGATQEIIRRLHKKLEVTNDIVDVIHARYISENTYIWMLHNPQYLVKSKSRNITSKMFKGYLPTKILSDRMIESPDTPENRFVKYFLGELLYWTQFILSTRYEIEKDIPYNKQLREELNELSNFRSRLEEYLVSGLFSDISEMSVFPYNSQVLLRKDGYRELFELWKKFKTYTPFFEGLRDAIDRKDIPTLYEYWCFFKLVKDLGEVFENKIPELHIKVGFRGMESGFEAAFNNGYRLIYRYHPESYSKKRLEPDFSLLYRNKLVGVFDAKFKIDKKEEGDSIKLGPKTDDITKMHGYKDAFRIRFAIILYPGEETELYSQEGTLDIGDKGGESTSSLFYKIIFSGFKGVGYISYLPQSIQENRVNV